MNSNQYTSVLERWVDRIEVDPSGCWLWVGTASQFGYGRMAINGRQRAAHRVGYELLVGDVPDGLVLDHLCRVRRCVNPVHLEPVTNRENVMRAPATVATINAAKKECRYCGGELAVRPQSSRFQRFCKPCYERKRRERTARLRVEGRCTRCALRLIDGICPPCKENDRGRRRDSKARMARADAIRAIKVRP